MFTVTLGSYTLLCKDGGLPDLTAEYLERAVLAEKIDLSGSDGRAAFLAVRRGDDWPFLVMTQRYKPAGGGFQPGALLVPETDRLFVGAGTRLLAYDLAKPAQLWEDYAEVGFWSWRRHNDTVLMSAELELAAWNLNGIKLWSRPVEPPWSYDVSAGKVTLDVMGYLTAFDLVAGPARP